jgi:hypothetical protein
MVHGLAGPGGLPGVEGSPVEGRVIWAGGQLLHRRGGLSAWRMRSGQLAEWAEREEVFGSNFKWASAQ